MNEFIENLYKVNGYNLFTKGDYNLNITGIRRKRKENKLTDKFDDILCLDYKVNGKWIHKEYPITTLYGSYYGLKVLGNKKGTAILKQGRWKYKLGKHNGLPALVQAEPVEVLRDNTLDGIYNPTIEDKVYFSINIHRAGVLSKLVYNWSAGCQVFQKSSDFLEFLEIVKKSIAKYGETVTYTLIEL